MKKAAALFLSAAMCMTLLPQNMSFADGEESEYEEYEEEYEDEWAGIVLPDDADDFRGVHWEFDGETRTVTFSGAGTVDHPDAWHPEKERPWFAWDENDRSYQYIVKHIVIGEGITEIGIRAFQNCTYLESVTLPASLRTIRNDAFSSNERLTEVIIPEGVTELQGGAFSGCDALRSVILPDSVTEISGKNLFCGCNSLEEVRLPANLTDLPVMTFLGCHALTKLTLPDTIESVGMRCFQQCTALTLSGLPAALRTIGEQAFSDCEIAPEVTLPPDVTEIAEGGLPESWFAAQKCVMSTDGTLFSYRYDPDEWQNVILPDGVKTIAPYAFTLGRRQENADKQAYFNEITLPRSVEKICADAFDGCHMSGIRGYTGTYAQEYAQGNGYQFTALNVSDGTVRPLYGERTLSIANTGEMLGTGYPMNTWHETILRESFGSNPLAVKDAETGWEGSCYGLAVLQILLDSGSLPPAAFGAETIPDIKPTAENISFINCLHHVSVLPLMIGKYSDQTKETEKQHLARIITDAERVNAGAAPFLINIRTKGGMHAIVGYGTESGAWKWDGIRYDHRVLLWDSNYIEGGDKAQLYYDSKNMYWCIPAYGLSYRNAESDTGALLYALDQIPALFRYFTERVHPLAGDVNADAALSTADAVLMSRYLAEDEAITRMSGLYNADTDADGSIDIDDILYILRHLSA